MKKGAIPHKNIPNRLLHKRNNEASTSKTYTFQDIENDFDWGECTTETKSEDENATKKRKLTSDSTDSVGLKGSPKKRRLSIKREHTYR